MSNNNLEKQIAPSTSLLGSSMSSHVNIVLELDEFKFTITSYEKVTTHIIEPLERTM